MGPSPGPRLFFFFQSPTAPTGKLPLPVMRLDLPPATTDGLIIRCKTRKVVLPAAA